VKTKYIRTFNVKFVTYSVNAKSEEEAVEAVRRDLATLERPVRFLVQPCKQPGYVAIVELALEDGEVVSRVVKTSSVEEPIRFGEN